MKRAHSLVSDCSFRLIKKGLWSDSDELAAVQCRHLCEAGRDMIHTL